MAEPCVIKILGATATGFAAVDYNENKVAEGVAECVALRNFGLLERYQFHAADTMKKYLQKIADRNDRVQHPQLHIMVSYPGIPSEEEKAILLQDFKDTLDSLGYKDQPQAIWAHNDTEHYHFHAATVRVDRNTGKWINNSWEGVKARRILDQLRGIEHDKQLDKMLNYNYTSREQFQHILRANGYHFHADEENDNLEIFRAYHNVGTVSLAEIETKAEENKIRNKTDKAKQLERLKQVRAIISKYRDKSLAYIVDLPKTTKTKRGKSHTKSPDKASVKKTIFQGSSGLDMSELKKAQFKQFLIDLKRTAGLEIMFHKGDDGKVRGYSVIDNSKGFIYNGSSVMKLSALLNGKNIIEEIIPEVLAAKVSQEYRGERASKRDNITPSNVHDIVQEKLKEFKLSWREPSFFSSEVMSLTAEENCQKAIELISLAETQRANGNWKWEINAGMAAKHAYSAYIDDKRQKESATNTQERLALHAGHLHQKKAEEQQLTVAEKPKFVLPPFATHATIKKILECAVKDLGYTNLKGVKIPADFDLMDYTPNQYANRSLEFLREAYKTSGEERKRNLLNALNASSMAHEQHRRKFAASQNVKPKPAVKPVTPKIRPISFNGFTASVFTKDGKNFITVTVSGKNMGKALSAGHNAWYQQEPDKTEAARGLALHYFSQEFYLAKREEYKQQCIANGKLPYDMRLSNVRTGFGNVYGRIDYPNKDWDNNCCHKFSEKDRLPDETDKNLFIRKFGSEEADNFWGHTFKEIRDFFIDKPAEFEDYKAIGETLGVFNEIAAAFNDSMTTMLNVVFDNNADYVPSCGGGGNNSLPKKKDDDLLKNPRNLFMKPAKGKGRRI